MKNNIFIYMADLSGGGVERMQLYLIPELQALGWQVNLLLTRNEGELGGALPPDLPVTKLGGGRTLSDLIPLTFYLNRKRPDILLSSLGHNNIVALLANALAGFPSKVIITQHNSLSSEADEMGSWKYRILPWAYKMLAPLADGILAVSKGVAIDVGRLCEIPFERITTIYNPIIDRGFFERMAEKADHPWVNDASVPYFLSVGRLSPQKDHETLLRAFALLRQTHKARLVILGVGPLRGELDLLVHQLGIQDDVKFEGYLSNPLPFYRTCQALVLSSRYEGFGNVLVEALAGGVQVISTDCPYGPSEILQNGKFGTLVPVGSVKELSEAMRSSFYNRVSRENLVERAKEFSVELAALNYVALFEKVLSRVQRL